MKKEYVYLGIGIVLFILVLLGLSLSGHESEERGSHMDVSYGVSMTREGPVTPIEVVYRNAEPNITSSEEEAIYFFELLISKGWMMLTILFTIFFLVKLTHPLQ